MDELVHPDDLEAVKVSTARIVAEGPRDGTDVRSTAAGGDLLFYRWAAAPFTTRTAA